MSDSFFHEDEVSAKSGQLHIIELERVDGMLDEGLQFEIQGAMNVKVDPQPLEGVYESKLRMSRATATKLVEWLNHALKPQQK